MTRSPTKIQRKLVSELDKLKNRFNLGHKLEVEWLPHYVKYSQGRRLSGEVVLGNTIRVYEENEAEAIATLYHEFWDYVVSELIAPYERLINKLIALFEEETYRRKEGLVERLCDIAKGAQKNLENRSADAEMKG
jgi:hypothetical protein